MVHKTKLEKAYQLVLEHVEQLSEEEIRDLRLYLFIELEKRVKS